MEAVMAGLGFRFRLIHSLGLVMGNSFAERFVAVLNMNGLKLKDI